MKVGIVGSREFDGFDKMKSILDFLIKKFGSDLEVYSGAATKGADKICAWCIDNIGKYKNIKFHEFAPRHKDHRKRYMKPESYYGKEYSPSNYIDRDRDLAAHVDALIAFKVEGAGNKGTSHTIEFFEQKGNKKAKVIWTN